jgi:hypothetical protein
MGSPVIARLFALVLALVLAWAGFAAQEPVRAPAALGAGQALAALQDGSPSWHLDPSPAGEPGQHEPHDTQSHAETLSDLPALVPVRHAAQAPALTMARPGPYTLATLHPPYLDGLRRPPRPAHGAA